MEADEHATCVIQRCWRSFQLKRLYRFYRDLVREREKGDAAVLLRMVNPQEAGLAADAALGTHVRLRLGGLQFPPTIYYKIFTHRPVADMGAFAPRDYVLQQKVERPRHVKNAPVLNELMDEVEKIGWYQRVENNGWRPISHRILANPDDPITRYTAARRMVFHALPTVRKEEQVLRRKQRQRDWMMRLHREGRGPTFENPREGILREGPGDGNSVSERSRVGQRWGNGEGNDDEADEEELLAWTRALDFEAYRDTWSTIATTMGTEASVPTTLNQVKDALQYSEPFNVLHVPGKIVGLRQF